MQFNLIKTMQYLLDAFILILQLSFLSLPLSLHQFRLYMLQNQMVIFESQFLIHQTFHLLSYLCKFLLNLLFLLLCFLVIYKQDYCRLMACSKVIECNNHDTNLCNQDGQSQYPLFLVHPKEKLLLFYQQIQNKLNTDVHLQI